jgi:hypothetical protein
MIRKVKFEIALYFLWFGKIRRSDNIVLMSTGQESSFS